MIATIVVLLGGGIGAVTRFQLDGFVQDHTHGNLPLGTTVINISGALLLGVFVGLTAHHHLNSTAELGLGTGFCGGFTTFSSLMFETTRLAQDGALRSAVRTLSLNIIVGCAAAAIGLLVTGAL